MMFRVAGIVAFALLWPGVLFAQAQTEPEGGTPRRSEAARELLGGASPGFLHLARRIEVGTADEKSEFARVALEEMGFAFSEEAQKAREQKPDPKKPYNEEKDPRKWAAGTDAYASRLFAMSESIVMGATVDVLVTPEGAVMLTVDGKNVIVSGPRIDKPELLENLIIDRICLDPDCASVASSTFTTAASGFVSGRWNFTDPGAPVFTTSNGLNFLFEDDTNIAAKEQACTALAAELNSIVQSLKNLLVQRKSVDWSAIAVQPDTVESGLQILRINLNGDFIKLVLPQLLQAPYVLQSALPWVRSQVEGRRTEHYVNLPPAILN